MVRGFIAKSSELYSLGCHTLSEVCDLLPKAEGERLRKNLADTKMNPASTCDTYFGGIANVCLPGQLRLLWQSHYGKVGEPVPNRRSADKIVKSWTWQEACLVASILDRSVFMYLSELARKAPWGARVSSDWNKLDEGTQLMLRVFVKEGCLPDRIASRSAGDDFRIVDHSVEPYDLVTRVARKLTRNEIYGVVVAYGYEDAAALLSLEAAAGMVDMDAEVPAKQIVIQYKVLRACLATIGV